jgi:glycosyltransferase involved in cell wall biosynthesis
MDLLVQSWFRAVRHVLRILYVNTPSYCGGSEISLLTLIDGLTRQGMQAAVVTTEKGALSDAVTKLNIPVRTQEFPWLSRRRPWRYLNSIAGLAVYIGSSRFDLIHTNCDHCLPYVMAASRLTNVPYVSHVRDITRSWFRPESRLRALQHAQAVIVASQAMLKYCFKHDLEPDKLKLISNPIELSTFFLDDGGEKRAALRASWGIPSDAIVVGIIGHIQRIKGHQEFIDAALWLLDQLNDVHFVIVGSAIGEEGCAFQASLRDQVASSLHASQIHFVGHHTDMPSVYKAIDIVAAPSWAEPFGRAAVEAMASGCAVVATDQGGHIETVQDGVNGLLVPPRNAMHLAGALSCLVGQASLRQALSSRGRISSMRFAAPEQVDHMIKLYYDVVNR